MTLGFFVFLSNFITNSIAPVLVLVAKDFDVTVTKASYLFSINLLFLGLGNLFWIPLSLKIGKRPVLVLCAIIFFVSSIWSAVAKSWGSLLGARIIQGFAASSVEGLGPTVIGDLFFVHERGRWMGLYIWVFSTGSSLGAVFAGLIANEDGDWRWVMWMNTILIGICLVLVVLFSAETNFKRPEEAESGEGLDPAELEHLRARTKSNWFQSLGLFGWYDRSVQNAYLPPFQHIMLTEKHREVSIWWLWWRPFLTLQYPAVLWGSLTYGSCLGALAFQISANAATFPLLYNFSPLATGNIGLSVLQNSFLDVDTLANITQYLTCGCIGAIVGGPVSDWIVAFVTKRRGGYYAPEFRLWCLIPPCVLLPVATMMWGAGIQNHLPPMVPIVASGMMWGILIAVSCTGLAYVVDCYRPLAGETMTALTAFKNTITFGMTFAVFPWIGLDGYVKVCDIFHPFRKNLI